MPLTFWLRKIRSIGINLVEISARYRLPSECVRPTASCSSLPCANIAKSLPMNSNRSGRTWGRENSRWKPTLKNYLVIELRSTTRFWQTWSSWGIAFGTIDSRTIKKMEISTVPYTCFRHIKLSERLLRASILTMFSTVLQIYRFLTWRKN